MTQRCKQSGWCAQGFTLVELMLAMTFISVLLLSIAMTAIQAGHIYNRGMVLRSINQSGRDIADSLRRDFLQANAKKIATANNNPVITLSDPGGVRSGRICLGYYTYVWNTAAALDSEAVRTSSSAVVRLTDSAHTPVNFARVIDEDGALCRADARGKYQNEIDVANTTHLLKNLSSPDEVVVALHKIVVQKITKEDDTEQLYKIQYVLGTSKLSEINTADNTCKPPADAAANLDFCAINNFDMMVRTNG